MNKSRKTSSNWSSFLYPAQFFKIQKWSSVGVTQSSFKLKGWMFKNNSRTNKSRQTRIGLALIVKLIYLLVYISTLQVPKGPQKVYSIYLKDGFIQKNFELIKKAE